MVVSTLLPDDAGMNPRRPVITVRIDKTEVEGLWA